MTRTWTCPTCHETHELPKSGPFSRCCLEGLLADCAFEAEAHIAMDRAEADGDETGGRP